MLGLELIQEKYHDAYVLKSCASVPVNSLCVSSDRYQTPFIKGNNEGSNPRVYVIDLQTGYVVGRYHWGQTIVLTTNVKAEDRYGALEIAGEFFNKCK